MSRHTQNANFPVGWRHFHIFFVLFENKLIHKSMKKKVKARKNKDGGQRVKIVKYICIF